MAVVGGRRRAACVKLPRTIALAGPSAAGTSSVGYRVAQRLGIPFLDTGAMYRALTWLALQRGVDIEDAQALGHLARPGAGPLVMAGRDIGTVVLPRAELKIYLDASMEERVRRRRKEMTALGREVSVAEVRRNIVHRDSIGSRRKTAPLPPAG